MPNNIYFDVISEIEAASAPLEEVISSLRLFEEHISRDVETLNPVQPYTVVLFVNRFNLSMALFRMIERELNRVANSLSEQINHAYEIPNIVTHRHSE